MTVMALHLGLRPEEAQRRGVPSRLVAADVFQSTRTLPDKHVYIGPGHFSHRWQVGPWSNPFLAGKDGTHFETVCATASGSLPNLPCLHRWPPCRAVLWYVIVLTTDCVMVTSWQHWFGTPTRTLPGVLAAPTNRPDGFEHWHVGLVWSQPTPFP